MYGYIKRGGNRYLETFTCFIDDKDELKKYLSIGSEDGSKRDDHFSFFSNKIYYLFRGNINMNVLEKKEKFIKTEYFDKLGQEIYLHNLEGKSKKILFILYGYYVPNLSVTYVSIAKIFDDISEYHKYLIDELKKFRDHGEENPISIWHYCWHHQHPFSLLSYEKELKKLNIDNLSDVTKYDFDKSICTYFCHKIIPIKSIKII